MTSFLNRKLTKTSSRSNRNGHVSTPCRTNMLLGRRAYCPRHISGIGMLGALSKHFTRALAHVQMPQTSASPVRKKVPYHTLGATPIPRSLRAQYLAQIPTSITRNNIIIMIRPPLGNGRSQPSTRTLFRTCIPLHVAPIVSMAQAL